MSSNIENNKRLAKNTLFLYFRMIITLVVGLYTSRVVLNVLGVSDYGIYNVIGGIVAIFATLNSAMSSTSSRYITFYLGKGNAKKLNNIFCTVTYIHVAIAVIVIILCETFGVWFFYNHMNIPPDRVRVAFWLLQFSFAASFLSMINIPYTGLIIAHENMNIYAYISIFDAIMKLAIAFLIQISPIDKLFFYGILIFIVQFLDFLFYRFYCVKNYIESHLKLFFDKFLFKELLSYCSWSIIGNLAVIINTQGVNLLLNVFFGPAVNAARGIAVQVQSIINQFVSNFQIALNPQIVKTYANHENNRMYQLMFASAKYGYLLLFLISLPIMIEAKSILTIWLKIVPDYTIVFLRIIILSCLVNALANSSTVAAGATGKIKLYNILVGGTVLLPVPISYIILKRSPQPELIFCTVLLFEVIALFIRLLFMRKMISLSIISFIKNVIFPITGVTLTSIWFPILYHYYSNGNLINTLICCLISFLVVCISIYTIGLSKQERNVVINIIKSRIVHNKR